MAKKATPTITTKGPHFTAERNDFLEAVKICSAAADRKATLPMLGYLLLHAEGDEVTVTGYDLVTRLSRPAAATIMKPGTLLLPSALLQKAVHSLAGKIDVSGVEPFGAELSVENATFKIDGLNPSEFPESSAVEGDNIATIPAQILARALGSVAHAMSDDETRAHLGGVFLQQEGKRLITVATDGHRLAQYQSAEEMEESIHLNTILSAKAVHDLLGLLKGCEDRVGLCVASNSLSTEINKTEFRSRFVEAQYPDYKQVIPKTSTVTLRANRALLLEGLKRLMVLAKSADNPAASISFTNRELFLRTPEQMGDHHEVVVNLPAEVSAPWTGMVGISVPYLLDAVSQQISEEVQIDIIDAMSPVTIKAASDGDGLLCVVMPIRL